MTGLEEMDVVELRAELTEATDAALRLAGEIVTAAESGDLYWTVGIALALKPALLRVARLKRALTLGVAR